MNTTNKTGCKLTHQMQPTLHRYALGLILALIACHFTTVNSQKTFILSGFFDFVRPAYAEDSDKAAPELGYGEKSDKEIMAERPRQTRIGVLGPMGGDLGYYGTEASNGAELASDEINEKGGIRNKQYDLLIFDTKGSIAGTRAGVEAFLKHEVLAVVGAATGEVSFAATKALNDRQLIMISAGSRRRLGDTGPYNFRNTLNDNQGIKQLIEYLGEKKKWKRFALFSSLLNDYSIKLTAAFKAEIVAADMTITDELFLWSKAMTNMADEETSIAGQIRKLKNNIPDAIVFTGDGKEAEEIVRELNALGLHIPLVGSEDLMIPEFAKLGELAKGSIVYSGFDADSTVPAIKAFVDAYSKRFGSKPSRMAALSYDAYYMLAEAISNSKSMRPSHVKSALVSLKGFTGVTGIIDMDPTGEAIKAPFIFEVKKNGPEYRFTTVQDPFTPRKE